MRNYLYLLGAIIFDAPSPGRFEAARSLTTALRAQDLPAGHAAIVERIDSELTLTPQLACEHSRLFVLGNPDVAAQPYAAYWLEGQLMGECTVNVARHMEAFGFGVDRASGLLPDHIVAELEFLALLSDLETPAARDALEAFNDQHLVRWVPLFTRALRRADPAPHPLYAAAADLLDLLLTEHRPWPGDPVYRQHAPAALSI
ncbi:TorA maturation chaperone TorD [Alkalispirillum mobile]|uniref:TorA maturation chaperone TorD n=1 Tax=Alkalispirillum mobile TaxID=85925 RepID=A0A498C7J5_9GAMM|nr:molecular chaperone TorD family protein [Alkalispirillum mobile]RLK51077.1 TorA maturation chaperone TorD [Alkalispirillum mobile]